ncbi:hypothetical protein K469DRAFT_569865, partial [Zopfia rhizophila CBS 207.26]
FYLVENTLAVCLTQSLLPDQDTLILFRRYSDIYNILFTTYIKGDCKLNFTYYNLKAKIITYNIIIFTLILDNDAGVYV